MTHGDTGKNALRAAILTAMAGGSLNLYTAADALLVSIPLNTPAFTNDATPGKINLSLSPAVSGVATGAGTVTKFIAKDPSANAIYQGTVTVTGGGGELTIDVVAILVGGVITVSGHSYTACA